MTTTGKLMLGIAAFILLMSAVYWFLSYEHAGSVLLLLSAGLVLITGSYLVVATRKMSAPADGPGGVDRTSPASGEEHEEYLPHASVWPLGLGAGSVVLANGLALGLWAIVPGTIILAVSVVGYARQSRHRN